MTLLLRYAGPLMAFGTTGRYDRRPTDPDPSLSALQGMVAAAAGIRRHDPLPDWITGLHPAIRVDVDGSLLVDYHTVNDPPARRYRHLPDKDQSRIFTVAQEERDGKGRPLRKGMTIQSWRGYRTDATYLIAINDPTGNITEALNAPRFTLYAGRKSCPLTEPFLLGHTGNTPEDAIRHTPTVPSRYDQADAPTRRRAVMFTDPGDATRHEDRNDHLVGFRRHQTCRRWHTTVTPPVTTDWFTVIDQLREAN